MAQAFDVRAEGQNVGLDDAVAVQQGPRGHASTAVSGDALVRLIEASDSDDIDQVAGIVQSAKERTVITNGRHNHDALARELVDLSDERFVHKVVAAVRQVDYVDTESKYMIESIQKPLRVRLMLAREQLEDVHLGVGS